MKRIDHFGYTLSWVRGCRWRVSLRTVSTLVNVKAPSKGFKGTQWLKCGWIILSNLTLVVSLSDSDWLLSSTFTNLTYKKVKCSAFSNKIRIKWSYDPVSKVSGPESPIAGSDSPYSLMVDGSKLAKSNHVQPCLGHINSFIIIPAFDICNRNISWWSNRVWLEYLWSYIL